MIKYEYKHAVTSTSQYLDDEIIELGKQGWEMIFGVTRGKLVHTYFKRPIEEKIEYHQSMSYTAPLKGIDEDEIKKPGKVKEVEKLYTRDEVVKMLEEIYFKIPTDKRFDTWSFLERIQESILNKIKSL